MGAPRFFIPPSAALPVGSTVELPDAALHHATRVVRLAVGSALTLFDGTGGEYAATMVRADRRHATVRVLRHLAIERESPFEVTLAQGVAASDAMDYAVRKATELGVTAIQPLVTARSAPLPSGDRGDRRLLHWRQIAIAACEQCGRNRVPAVLPPRPLAEWLAAWQGSGVVLAPGADLALAALAALPPPLALLVGPEGGFDDRESQVVAARRFREARLGPRVLRTETAAVAALAVLQSMWGDGR